MAFEILPLSSCAGLWSVGLPLVAQLDRPFLIYPRPRYLIDNLGQRDLVSEIVIGVTYELRRPWESWRYLRVTSDWVAVTAFSPMHKYSIYIEGGESMS